MKIVFLGTNGWYSSPTGDTPCVLIDSKDHYVVFNAGNGIYKLDQYIKEPKSIFLFISHFHIDHVSGLHTLAKFNFPQGLDICVAEGRKKDFETLVAPPFTIGYQPNPVNVSNLKMDIRLHEISQNPNDIPFPVVAIEQHHAYKDHGYRVTLEDKIIAYSGDCGISATSQTLVKDADILIHECANVTPEESAWGHVDPTQAAQLAKENGVKKLILNHFDASQYTTIKKRKNAEKIAQAIFPNTTAATDGLIVEL